MADLNKLLTPLFLNEVEIRKIIELLFFSYRDFTEGPDKILEKINQVVAIESIQKSSKMQLSLRFLNRLKFQPWIRPCIRPWSRPWIWSCIWPWMLDMQATSQSTDMLLYELHFFLSHDLRTRSILLQKSNRIWSIAGVMQKLH